MSARFSRRLERERRGEPTDSEGREAKAVSRRGFVAAIVATAVSWFVPKRAVAQPVAEGVPYSAMRTALLHEQRLARKYGIIDSWNWINPLDDLRARKLAADAEVARLELGLARGEYVHVPSWLEGREASGGAR
jgi:hypothetical protein